MGGKEKNNCCAARWDMNGKRNSVIPDNQKISPSELQRGIEKMTLIEGDTFLMGTDSKEGFSEDGEGPVRKVRLNSFYIDKTAVTNAQFRQFVKDTGYIYR